MKRLIRFSIEFVVALALTLPVFLLITKINAIPAWLYSAKGYAALDPLFNLFGAVGVEGHEDVILGVLLLASFAIAIVIVAGADTFLRRRAQRA
ncbi:hypothetical protein [Paraburkholderia bannensis]|uniref:hypothetical protein n=1 Tax=Paraburkholderia bannensis TaxID=765414 RepID=UPI002AB674C4|nr:hypothetical protein [Paraburkholderia bannensis]